MSTNKFKYSIGDSVFCFDKHMSDGSVLSTLGTWRVGIIMDSWITSNFGKRVYRVDDDALAPPFYEEEVCLLSDDSGIANFLAEMVCSELD